MEYIENGTFDDTTKPPCSLPALIASLAKGPRRRSIFSLIALLCALLAGISQAQAAEQVSIPRHVNRVARSATILIQTPASPGSAVVIKNSPDSCVVITAFHVVEVINEKEYGDLLFPSGATLKLRPEMITRVQGTDFALLRMPTSCPVAQVAVQGSPNDVHIGDRVYISGFSANISPEVVRPSFRVVSGTILSLSEQRDGYSLTYDTNTVSGMSGGPIFASNGTLIGLHGRGETLAYTGEKIASMGMSVRLARELAAYTPYEPRPTELPQPLRLAPCPGVVC